jgi:hypothetical protein
MVLDQVQALSRDASRRASAGDDLSSSRDGLVAAWQRVRGEDLEWEPTAPDVLHRLASVLVTAQAWEAAEACGRRVVELERLHEPARPLKLGTYLLFLSRLLERRQEFPEAAACAEEATPLYASAFGAGHREALLVRDLAVRLRSQAET